jgi:hypothetical protein
MKWRWRKFLLDVYASSFLLLFLFPSGNGIMPRNNKPIWLILHQIIHYTQYPKKTKVKEKGKSKLKKLIHPRLIFADPNACIYVNLGGNAIILVPKIAKPIGHLPYIRLVFTTKTPYYLWIKGKHGKHTKNLTIYILY